MRSKVFFLILILGLVIPFPLISVKAGLTERTIIANLDDCSKWGVKNGGTLFGTGKTTAYVGYYSATKHEMGAGFRFQNIDIPQGWTITSAYLKPFCFESNNNVIVNSKIHGEATDNAVAFSTEANFDNRIRTSAVEWNNIGAWVINTRYSSPNIKTIIQEIVNRVGWSSGNAIVIFWGDFDNLSDNEDLHQRRHDHREIGSGTYTQLTITWEQPQAPSNPNLLFGAGFNSSSPYVELHWNHTLENVEFFEIQNSTDKISWEYLGQSDTANYTDYEVFNGTARYYRVRACNYTDVWLNSSFCNVDFEIVYFVSEIAGENGAVESDAPWIALAIILSIVAGLLFTRIKR